MTEIQNVITVKELAQELKVSPKSLRKWMRDNKIEKPGSRWEWSPEDATVGQIRNWRNGQKEKVQEAAAEVKEAIQEPEVIIPEGPVTIFTQGNWTVWKNPEGAVQAIYQGPNSKDSTPWITEKAKIRKTLPKHIKAIMEGAIQ
jgi:hypothetical protein